MANQAVVLWSDDYIDVSSSIDSNYYWSKN